MSHLWKPLLQQTPVFILEGCLSISICSSTQVSNIYSTKAMHYRVTLWQSHVSNLWWVTNWLNVFPQTVLGSVMLEFGMELKIQNQELP